MQRPYLLLVNSASSWLGPSSAASTPSCRAHAPLTLRSAQTSANILTTVSGSLGQSILSLEWRGLWAEGRTARRTESANKLQHKQLVFLLSTFSFQSSPRCSMKELFSLIIAVTRRHRHLLQFRFALKVVGSVTLLCRNSSAAIREADKVTPKTISESYCCWTRFLQPAGWTFVFFAPAVWV